MSISPLSPYAHNTGRSPKLCAFTEFGIQAFAPRATSQEVGRVAALERSSIDNAD
jgi:hypothetical protein